MIQRSQDIPKARALFMNGNEIYESVKESKGKPRFLLLNYYAAILDYAQSLLSAEGVKITEPDHHKAAFSFIILKYPEFTPADRTTLENLRYIRNDIQYYGTKSTKDIEEFFEYNRSGILLFISKLQRIIENKIKR